MSRKRMPMNAIERALWEDAEGSLYVPEHLGKTERRPVLLTSQLDKDIQLDYCAGARRDGVKCYVVTARVRKTEKTPRGFTFYITQVRDQVSLARELRLTAPYRRNKKIRARVRKYKAWLALPRRQLRRGRKQRYFNTSHYYTPERTEELMKPRPAAQTALSLQK